MYTFSLFLEAMISRDAIPMDQDDINYLNQFPKHFWINAIKQRYNDLLLQAINGGITDPVSVTVRTATPGISSGGTQTFNVNARMDKVLKKLKNLGYDLSDPHPETQTLSNMKLMNREQARTLIKNWLNYSQQQGSRGLMPGFARFTPTKLEKVVQSYDNPQDNEARRKWIELQPVVKQEVEHYTKLFIKRLSYPENPLHLNYYYWSERPDELIQGASKRIQDNLANPKIFDPIIRRNLINNYLSSAGQKGHANRRMLVNAKDKGMDIPGLIKKGYTMNQIASAIKDRTFRVTGSPQQQNYLKSIHQSVETPASTMANYGNKTIGSLRQNYTQKVMQSPELQKNVKPYNLSPEYKPQKARRAARDLGDIISFKDWIHRQP
jgi:hypothetical protein